MVNNFYNLNFDIANKCLLHFKKHFNYIIINILLKI